MWKAKTARPSDALIVVLVLALIGSVGYGTETAALASEGAATTVVSLPTGAQVAGVAVGAGAVWVANGRSGTVSRIDAQTMQVVSIVPVAEPWPGCERCWGGVAADADAVWATMNSAGPVIVRIDARLNRVVATIPVGIVPDRLALDEQGAVWLTSAVQDAVVRVDPRTGRAGERIRVHAPSSVAVAYDSLWVTTRKPGANGQVVRLDPRTERVVATIPVGREPGVLAIGAGGVWVANEGDHTVSRIDPHTNAVAATIPVVHFPVGIAIGEGAVWVASRGFALLSVPSVSQIDPGANSVVETMPMEGMAPIGMVAGERGLWVASRNPDALVRIGPVPLPASGPATGSPLSVPGILGVVTVLLLAAGLVLRRSRRTRDRPLPDGHLLSGLAQMQHQPLKRQLHVSVQEICIKKELGSF